MAFAQFDNVIISNIFSYLAITEIIPTKEEIEKAKRFPKCARKEFVDSLHPYYLLIWRLKDYYNGWSHYTENVVFNAITKKLPNEYVFYLIEEAKFRPTLHDLEPIFKSENLEMMKFYHKKGIMVNINLHVASYFVEVGSQDIIEWLFVSFEKHMMQYRKSLIGKAIQENKVEITDFLYQKDVRMFLGHEFNFRKYFEFLEWRLRNDLISAEILDWLWKNDYRWTREDAEAFGNEKMKKYF